MFKNMVTRGDFLTVSGRAAEIENKKLFPAAVVGAGLGGLFCAARLARAGYPVTVIEQRSKPGGYASAFDRADGKFTFEVSLHGASLKNNHISKLLEKLGVMEKLELVELPELYKVKTPSREYSVPQKDPEKYIRILSRLFPEQADGIAGFVRELVDIVEEFDRYCGQSDFSRRFTDVLFPLRFRKTWKIRNKTLEQHLKQYVSDPECRAALGSLWVYYGLPPSRLSAFYYAIATGGYLKNGSYYIRDRSRRLSAILAETVRDSGGVILYNSKAEKIAITDGRVSGVALSDGRKIPARAVAANCSAPAVFEKMIPVDNIPPDYLKKLKSCRPGISSFIVWLGLDRSLRGLIDGYGFYMQRADSPDQDYQDCIEGRPDRGFYAITIYDNLFEGYSAPGSSTIMVLFLCGYGPWKKFENDYWKGNKDDYRRQKEKWTDILIERAEKDLIPGLSGMIEVVEAATPLTNIRFTGCAGGAIYGYEQSLDNSFMNRISEATPIEGLFLAGAWGNPGGGIVGVLQAGERAFESMVRYHGKCGKAKKQGQRAKSSRS